MSSTSTQLLKIGAVAQESGLSIKTIRYYDGMGLLMPSVRRNQAKYRLFEPMAIKRLKFIKKLQSLGLTLKEIKNILDVYDSGNVPCAKIKGYLLKQLENINTQIDSLNSLKKELQNILVDWQELSSNQEQPGTICPNIN
jgi:MerR family copper efflux transcriptional regulator